MKKLLLLFLASLGAVCCAAQTFSLSVKTMYAPTFKNQYFETFESTGTFQLNEEQSLETKYLIERFNQKKYESKIGDGLSLNISFAFNPRFSIHTGLGFQYSKFKVNNENISYTQDILSTDTVAYDASVFGNTFAPCDRYTNTYEEFLPIEEGEQYSLFLLHVPLEVSYSLMNNKLFLRPGVFLQTPLFTKKKREFVSFEREMIEDELICTYEKFSFQDKSGSNIQNFQWGASFHVAYRVMKWLELEAGVAQNFSNVFYRNEEWSNFYGNDENYRPLNISLGLNFLLVKKKEDL